MVGPDVGLELCAFDGLVGYFSSLSSKEVFSAALASEGWTGERS